MAVRARRFPAVSKIATEQSRRSLMFGEYAVLTRVAIISSAAAAKRCAMTSVVIRSRFDSIEGPSRTAGYYTLTGGSRPGPPGAGARPRLDLVHGPRSGVRPVGPREDGFTAMAQLTFAADGPMKTGRGGESGG